MEDLNYANFLSIIQVAVALNFGLLYLKKGNAFRNIYKEVLQYFAAFVHSSTNNASMQTRRVRSGMPIEIREQKALVKRIQNKLADLTGRDYNFPFIPCLGIFSGFYAIVLLLLIAMFGKENELLQNYIAVFAEIVCTMDLLAIIQMYRSKKQDENEYKARFYVVMNILWFFIFSIIGFILTTYDWTFHCIPNFSYLFFFALFVVYIPSIWLLSEIICTWVRVIFNQKKCVKETRKLKKMLDNI